MERKQCIERDLGLCSWSSGQQKEEMSTWGLSEHKSLWTVYEVFIETKQKSELQMTWTENIPWTVHEFLCVILLHFPLFVEGAIT